MRCNPQHSVSSYLPIMPCTSNAKKKAAANVCTGKACKRTVCVNILTNSDALDDEVIKIPAPPLLTQIHNYSGPDDDNNDDGDSDNDICHWTGGVNNSPLSSDMGETGSSEGELLSGEELEGDVLVESLQKEVENKL